MSAVYDVAVIGAGPAGLAAATFAARYALRTVLVRRAGTTRRAMLRPADRGHPDALGVRTPEPIPAMRSSQRSASRAQPRCSMRRRGRPAAATTGCARSASRTGRRRRAAVRIVLARAMIIATGAHARPFPIPGGTLDGSIGAAEAQALLDAKGVDASRRIVLAGNGPAALATCRAIPRCRRGARSVARHDAARTATTRARQRSGASRCRPTAFPRLRSSALCGAACASSPT